MSTESHKKEAVSMSCDLVRQFVNIAVGGIAFTVGVSPMFTISSSFCWTILIIFGLSITLGLLFQMHSIALVWSGEYNTYALSLRFLAGFQFLLVAVGIVLIGIAIL